MIQEFAKNFRTLLNHFTALKEIVVYKPDKGSVIRASVAERDEWALSKNDKPSKKEFMGLNWLNMDDCIDESVMLDDETSQHMSEIKRAIEKEGLMNLKEVKFLFFKG